MRTNAAMASPNAHLKRVAMSVYKFCMLYSSHSYPTPARELGLVWMYEKKYNLHVGASAQPENI